MGNRQEDVIHPDTATNNSGTMDPYPKGNGTTRARHKKKRGKDQSKVVTGETSHVTARGIGNLLKSAFPNHKTDSTGTKKKGDSSSPREERTTSKSNSLLDKYGRTNKQCPREERTNKSNLLLAKYGQKNKKSIAQNVIEKKNNLNSVEGNIVNSAVNASHLEVEE